MKKIKIFTEMESSVQRAVDQWVKNEKPIIDTVGVSMAISPGATKYVTIVITYEEPTPLNKDPFD